VGRRGRPAHPQPSQGDTEIASGLVLVNGHILTLDPRRPVVDALAVADGRIAAVGSRRQVERARDRRARVIDLRGATVIPGLVDAHAHLDREGLKTLYPSLARCRSIADIQRLVRARAARQKPGSWIVTMPVGAPPFYQGVPECLAEGRWPTRADLDAAAPDHPVYIRGIWGYWNRPPVYSVANSRALELAGITGATAPPRGVEILKEEDGRPTGVFVEHNLIQVIELTLMRAAPRFTAEDRRRALAASQRSYAARGVTAVYEGHGIAPEVLAAYRESHAAARSDCGAPSRSARRGAPPRPTARSPRSRRGRAGAGSATTGCGSAASACTTAETRRSPASCTRPSPTPRGPASWRAPTIPPPMRSRPSWPRATASA